MDDTPIDDAPTSEPFERENDIAILEALEVELAEVEAALHRLDTDDAAETRAPVEPQT